MTPKNMFLSVRQLLIEFPWKYRLFPGGTQDQGHKFSYIQRKLVLTLSENFLLGWYTQRHDQEMWFGGGHPYLTSQINKFSLTMWTRQEVAHSPYQIQTKNLSSLTVSPQRTLLLKEGNLAWDPPLGFSQSFHRHLPRALFFQVLIEMKQRICFP